MSGANKRQRHVCSSQDLTRHKSLIFKPLFVIRFILDTLTPRTYYAARKF
jgi:hypothetical protein